MPKRKPSWFPRRSSEQELPRNMFGMNSPGDFGMPDMAGGGFPPSRNANGYPPFMSPQQGGNGGDDNDGNDDDAKYEPSSTLRELVIERLREQQLCLNEISNTYLIAVTWNLEQIALNDGNPNAPKRKKGPGDQHIDAKQVKQITKNGHFSGLGGGFGEPYVAYGGRRRQPQPMPDPNSDWVTGKTSKYPARSIEDHYRMMTSRGAGLSPSYPPWQSPADRSASGGPKPGEKSKDPMIRYHQLGREIVCLMAMTGGQAQGGADNPYREMADLHESTTNPTEGQYKRINKVVGSGTMPPPAQPQQPQG